MTLPISPPFAPMEVLRVFTIPSGGEWQYEPKWDGFRCLVFKDGKQVELQSKKGESLNRYFPELLSPLRLLEANRYVIDGEIVVPAGEIFSFDDLLQRIHPAQSRVRKLAKERPAKLIVFDLLVSADGVSRLECHCASVERYSKNSSVKVLPTIIRASSSRRQRRRSKMPVAGCRWRAGHLTGSSLNA